MRQIGTYVVVALIAAALGAFAASKYFDNREPEVIVKRDTMYIQRQDSTGFTLVDQTKVETAPVFLTLPKGFTLPSGVVLQDSVQVEATKYTGTQELENGTIDFEIYAKELLAYNFNLTTEDRVITETITKTLPPKSALFAGGGLNYSPSLGVQSAEFGLMYNRRQKWQLGAVVTQDLSGLLPSGSQTSFGVRAYVKL